MSVNFFADTIAAADNNNNIGVVVDYSMNPASSKVASGQEKSSPTKRDDYNSMSKVETQTLMDNRRYQHHHHEQKGTRQGTPDANNSYASMSSDSINNSNINSVNNNNNQEQQQHVTSSNASQQAASLFSQLQEALALEPKYQPNLFLPQQSNVSDLILYFPHHYHDMMNSIFFWTFSKVFV